MSPRAGLDILTKRKFLPPARNQTPVSSLQPVTILTINYINLDIIVIYNLYLRCFTYERKADDKYLSNYEDDE